MDDKPPMIRCDGGPLDGKKLPAVGLIFFHSAEGHGPHGIVKHRYERRWTSFAERWVHVMEPK